MTMRILGLIPARGGSKGVPRKNIVDLCGRPLIAWSIDTGLELLRSGTLSKCIVSTDDPEIAQISRDLGADVPFIRPKKMATDFAKSVAVVEHALDVLASQGYQYDAVMLLQPTNPIRHAKSIEKATKELEQSDSNSLISCYQEDYVNELVMYRETEKKRLLPVNKGHNKGVRRQKHGSIMVRNGAVYVTKVAYLLSTGNLVCDSPMALRMLKSESIGLDTPEDLEYLRRVLCK